MDVVRMLSVAGYAWNFDCVQPPLAHAVWTYDFLPISTDGSYFKVSCVWNA